MRTHKKTAPTLKKQPSDGNGSIYQIKVTLAGVRPPIWRRILVPMDLRLDRLHAVLQIVMGWTNSHLHQFIVGDDYYSDPRFELDELDLEIFDERKATVEEVLPRVRSKAVYEYDFGDSWEHLLVVEKRLAQDPALEYPLCLEGERACPPEDCGGVGGYDDLLLVLEDPKHEEHEEMLEWLGDTFNPEAFNAAHVNEQLRQLAMRWQRRKKSAKGASGPADVMAQPRS